MKRMKRIFTRLRARRGESIAEALIGLLIAALALTLLAGMIGSSSRIIRTGEQAMSEYVDGQNALNARTSGSPGSVALNVDGGIPNRLTDGGSSGSIPVDVYSIQAGGQSIVAYSARGSAGPTGGD